MDGAAIILSGGRNSRMGRNKAFVNVNGKAIIAQIIETLRPVAAEIIVVTNCPDEYRHLGVSLTGDIIANQGPLSGIHAGLSASNHRNNLVVACDMPFVEAPLAQALLELAPGYDVVVPQWRDYLQPLFAVYAKTCIAPIEACLRGDIRKIIAFYPQVRVRYAGEPLLRQWGDPERIFFNVNTPADLAAASAMDSPKAAEGTDRCDLA
ncbi:NTP transferase domain-containing protein [Heliobacterium gestii]|uniref:Probable molybdenum cofactor guanylyltransferase n=1 Tax=Heliomicrobium gestii TaxID=2699 RepID=A0A845LG07_HELGE|nr:molybdenum cofactor guanylyltransferase [Heliomicrobium gestii]MBM7865535.1 molybdopterin-guanine dinucleotide biosynthesis protein A [Heliomicrobium gestii]MZP41786.1 NTP transferase domain-containing protein [Heliomicrobium gestii]